MAVASLKCGDYEVYLAKRGGRILVCKLTGTESISFNRTLNDFSEARISVAVDSNCADCLATANPWEHEILVFRSSELVWCGPLISLTYQTSKSRVQLYARDLLAWTDKRFIEIYGDDFDVEEVDVAAVFDWVLNHGYEKDPWNMGWSLSATGIPITKYYPAFSDEDRWGGSYPIVGSELRSLSTTGVDFTVVNRHMYGGDLVVRPPSPITLRLTNQSWLVTPDIVVDGARMSTRTAVAGGSGGYFGYYDGQMWIEQTEMPWGLLETFTTRSDLGDEDTTETPNAIAQEAYARHVMLSVPVAYISGGQLAGDAPFKFNDLIPGIPIDIALLHTVRQLQNSYRLYGVEVSVTKDSEKINITLSAPGVEEVR